MGIRQHKSASIRPEYDNRVVIQPRCRHQTNVVAGHTLDQCIVDLTKSGRASNEKNLLGRFRRLFRGIFHLVTSGILSTAWRSVSVSMCVYSRETASESWPMISRATTSLAPAFFSRLVAVCRRQ